jgi:hypothetical protein
MNGGSGNDELDINNRVKKYTGNLMSENKVEEI